jgi:hypothetical protein
MSEQLTLSPEKHTPAVELTAERPQAAEYSEADKTQHIEQAQATVAIESAATEQPTLPQFPVTDDRPQFIDNAIKTLRMRRNLGHVQNKLKPAEKSFSKVVHQPLVQLVSESAAKTISRPSGILGGGIVAFIGSLGYLYLSRHLGFTYNYLFFLVFFIAGFALGSIAEYTLYWFHKKSRFV